MDNDKNYLQGLRDQVVNGLVSVSDSFVQDENVSYDLLISLARSTNNKKLLGTAYERIKTIEDPKQRGDAMLALLDEIEMSLSELNTPQPTNEVAPTDENPAQVDISAQPQDQ